MKFSEMPYERPDLTAAFAQFDAMAQAIAAAPGAADVLAQYAAFEKLAGHLSTMATLAEVRHTIDTRDAFYEAERQFFDENSPRLADKQLEVY
ncbi:MAG: M3 family oligoendopeptidase, partial [Ruthenibacterium sp.]